MAGHLWLLLAKIWSMIAALFSWRTGYESTFRRFLPPSGAVCVTASVKSYLLKHLYLNFAIKKVFFLPSTLSSEQCLWVWFLRISPAGWYPNSTGQPPLCSQSPPPPPLQLEPNCSEARPRGLDSHRSECTWHPGGGKITEDTLETVDSDHPHTQHTPGFLLWSWGQSRWVWSTHHQHSRECCAA